MKLYVFKVKFTRNMAECAIDAQKMHKFLCSATGGSRQDSGTLYRFDRDSCTLFVQSSSEIDQKQDLKLIGIRDLDQKYSSFDNGGYVRFLLTTNPYKRQRSDHKRKYLSSCDDRITWVRDRLTVNGLNPLRTSEARKNSTFICHSAEKGGKVEFTTYDYLVDGYITDKDQFIDLCKKGLGREKAYGSGMFLILKYGKVKDLDGSIVS